MVSVCGLDDPVFRDAALGVVASACRPGLVPASLRSRPPVRGQHPASSGFGALDRWLKTATKDRAHGTCPVEVAAVMAKSGPFHLECLQSQGKRGKATPESPWCLSVGIGKEFQEAIGELDQAVPVVGQNEILVLSSTCPAAEVFPSSRSFHSPGQTEGWSRDAVRSPWRTLGKRGSMCTVSKAGKVTHCEVEIMLVSRERWPRRSVTLQVLATPRPARRVDTGASRFRQTRSRRRGAVCDARSSAERYHLGMDRAKPPASRRSPRGCATN